MSLLFRVQLRRAVRIAELQNIITAEEASQAFEVVNRPLRIIRGRRIDLMAEAESDARDLYAQTEPMSTEIIDGEVRAKAIDWSKLLDWLVQHLPDVLAFLLKLLQAEPSRG